MATRTRKYQTLSRVAIIGAILILVNIISVRLFGRIDMTRNHIFTLSEASKALMRGLDDRVTVRAYFTEDLPSPYNNTRRMLLDELNEYRAYAKGNMQYEFISPAGEKGEQEAQQQGIAPVQIQVVKEEKFSVERAYMGVVILYEDKKEVIPVVQNTANLEYELSSAIKRITSRGVKKIGLLTGHGEPGLNELQHVQEALRRQYELTQVDVGKGAAVPADIAALVIMAPATRFAEPDKFRIDQYLMRGGRVAFLLNKVDANLRTPYGRPVDLNLDDMLAAYGLRENADLVRDAQCASVSIVQQQFGFSMQSQVPFPLLPLVSNFNKENAIVKDLQGVILFFASSVDTLDPSSRGLRAEILLRSSKQSGRMTGMFMIDPLQRYTKEDLPAQFGEKGIPLAALVQGTFRSAFAGKPVPADTGAGAAPAPANPLTGSQETRVVLFGDGDFPRDQYAGNQDNVTLFANTIDYMVDDAGLITIRSKEAAMPPLEQVSDGTKKAVKYANLIVPPVLVLGYGLFRWRLRRARRKP
jgi:gliding-associated putative ABC transporter substrate-binding component GldG